MNVCRVGVAGSKAVAQNGDLPLHHCPITVSYRTVTPFLPSANRKWRAEASRVRNVFLPNAAIVIFAYGSPVTELLS